MNTDTNHTPGVPAKPDESSPVYFLMMAGANYIKNLMSVARRYPVASDPVQRQHLTDITTQADRLMSLLKRQRGEFLLHLGSGEQMREQLRLVEVDFLRCAMLPLNTSVTDWPDLMSLITSFEQKQFTTASVEVVEALKGAPGDFNGQIRILIHRYAGQSLGKDRQESLASAIEQTYHFHRQLHG